MKQGTLVFKSTKGASTSAKPKPKPAPAKRSIPIEDSSDEEDVEEISPTVQPPPPPATEHLDLKDKKGLYRKLHHDSAKLSGPLSTCFLVGVCLVRFPTRQQSTLRKPPKSIISFASSITLSNTDRVLALRG
jgi:hypothetical protein